MKKDWMPENPYPDAHYPGCQNEVFEDGCQQTARKMVKWGQQECKEHNPKGVYQDRVLTPIYYKRFECPMCIKQLRKEVGIDG